MEDGKKVLVKQVVHWKPLVKQVLPALSGNILLQGRTGWQTALGGVSAIGNRIIYKWISFFVPTPHPIPPVRRGNRRGERYADDCDPGKDRSVANRAMGWDLTDRQVRSRDPSP